MMSTWKLVATVCAQTVYLFLVDFSRAEAKLLEETARPLIDNLGEI